MAAATAGSFDFIPFIFTASVERNSSGQNR